VRDPSSWVFLTGATPAASQAQVGRLLKRVQSTVVLGTTLEEAVAGNMLSILVNSSHETLRLRLLAAMRLELSHG
jgi:hypothetical protein